MVRRFGIVVAVVLAGLAAACSPKATVAAGDGAASATDIAAFMGTWTHKGNIVAPWWSGPGFSPEPDPEIVAKPLVLTATSSTGAAALSCETAIYSVETSGLDGLFEGSLTDPDAARSALGIEKDQIPTLMEGCKSTTGDLELNYHLIDKDKLLLGLNDIVYQFERAKP